MALRKFSEPGGGFIREDGHHIHITIDAAAKDDGHTGHTSHLRAGLALGKVTSTGQYKQYAAGASDGTEECRGYLYHDVDLTLGGTQAAADSAGVLLVTGVVDQAKVYGSDAAARTDLDGKIWHESVS